MIYIFSKNNGKQIQESAEFISNYLLRADDFLVQFYDAEEIIESETKENPLVECVKENFLYCFVSSLASLGVMATFVDSIPVLIFASFAFGGLCFAIMKLINREYWHGKKLDYYVVRALGDYYVPLFNSTKKLLRISCFARISNTIQAYYEKFDGNISVLIEKDKIGDNELLLYIETPCVQGIEYKHDDPSHLSKIKTGKEKIYIDHLYVDDKEYAKKTFLPDRIDFSWIDNELNSTVSSITGYLSKIDKPKIEKMLGMGVEQLSLCVPETSEKIEEKVEKEG